MPITRDAVTRADGVGGRKHLDQIGNGDFDAPLKTNLHPVRGVGVPAFTRATGAWYFNQDNILTYVPSGCARFNGARSVQNLMLQSENLSTGWARRGACTVTGGNTDPRGGTTAYQVDNVGLPTVDDIYYTVTSSSAPAGRSLYIGFFLKRVSTTGILRVSNPTSTATGHYTIDLASIPDGWIYVDEKSPYVTINTNFSSSSSGNVGIQFANSGAGTISFLAWGMTSALYETINKLNAANEYVSRGVLSGFYHGANADGIKYFDTDATGSKINSSITSGFISETTRSNNLKYSREFTKGSASTARCWATASYGSELFNYGTFDTDATGWTFANATGAVSAGNLVVTATTSSPSARTTFNTIPGESYQISFDFVADTSTASMLFRVGNSVGAQDVIAEVNINTVPYNNVIHDFIASSSTTYFQVGGSSSYAAGETFTIDNVSLKKSKMGARQNEVGIDGIANSATTLKAIQPESSIIQQFTMASAARTFSIYIKRKTGTGTISITRDGGLTWTDVTSQINTGKFTRVAIRNTSVTDPACGIKISEPGDEIIIDCAQDESGAIESTPILTTSTSVTRNTDNLTYSVGNVGSETGTIYFECAPFDDTSFDRRPIAITGSTNFRAHYLYASKLASYGTGSGQTNTGNAAYNLGEKINGMMRWINGSPGDCFVNGTKLESSANVSVTPTVVDIGLASGSTFMGAIKNIKIFKRALSDEQCINSTLLGAD